MKENLSSKKICHLSSVHFCFDTRIFHRECKTLKEAGYQVIVIGQGGLIRPHPETEGILIEDTKGIKVISFSPPKNRFWRLFRQVKLFNIAKHQEARVYHFHDPELIPLGILLKLITRAKVIYDVHENYILLNRDWISRSLRKITTYALECFMKFASRYFDGLIVATDNIKQKFKHRNIKLVRNLYFNELPERIRPDKGRDNKQLKLIFTGGIVRDRGIDKIIKTLDVFKEDEVIFKLIGISDEPDYIQEIKTIAGFRNVEMKGWQSYDVVMEELAEADVGILTLLLNEVGLPNKMFEYMAMGLPIIASDSPGWRQIIEANKCGIIVDLMDTAEIERAIRFMLENPRARKEMGQNGIKATREKFNWDNEKQELLGLYENLLS